MKKRLVFCVVWLTSLTAWAPAPTPIAETTLLHAAHQLLTDIMVADVFSPPVASRIYAYAHIAAYEALIPFQKGSYRSLAGQLPSLSSLTASPSTECRPELAAIEAFLRVGKGLIFSEERLDKLTAQLWLQAQKRGYSERTIIASKEFGSQVALHILEWAKGDNYRQTRSLRRYAPTKKAGAWAPTPPGYLAAVEPYWARIRPLTLDSAAQCRTVGPPSFSTTNGSPFYAMVREVYDTGKNLTTDQRLIANYWDCNPFFLNIQGHLNFASKKLSPGGHWMAIAGQVARQTKSDLMATSAAYTLTAIALFDGFISCWAEKYQYNVIRPETYINAHLDESWRPVLQTPPFPEYPSGHSVVSTASAVVLTHFFGKAVSFTDSTEMAYGLPSRRFTSFNQAADEASISRLYGGIHYRPALDNGQLMGKSVGEAVLSKITLRSAAASKR
ncbi:vanadium-dependent haloperoxidase [Spirosoma validum]|uniref:Vanadium-dependent haloperoxidase n=1 Tax=Spirosoma validum TaxID=2771355 RepID=A0A927AZV7_9BACT|nr:vanadium-dependent haloperoxidase [Spirosoma validum]MBD2752702.1 vanadium-dependent haloperoxidase [Spirosoma validum]